MIVEHKSLTLMYSSYHSERIDECLAGIVWFKLKQSVTAIRAYLLSYAASEENASS